MLRFKCVILLYSTILAFTNAANYDGYKIFELIPKTTEQCAILYEWSKNEEFYDLFALSKLPNHVARVMVNPSEEENFLNALAQHNLTHKVVNRNVGLTLEQEFRKNKLKRKMNSFTGKGRLSTERFYSHDEINAYIEDLAKLYPDRIFVKWVGKSFEGRKIKTITITNGDGRANKNVIFLDGGFHGRVWISPAAVLYIIEQLAENFKENSDLLLNYDWILLPVVNPDGYEYSRSGSQNRYWHKTRQPYEYASFRCSGADPNRNFGFHWNEDNAPAIPCLDSYAGPKSFSEPETVIVRDLMHSFEDRGVMYLTMRSFGSYIFYPWSWTFDLPDTWQDLDEVARAGADAIFEATGNAYTYGSTSNVIYLDPGSSDDYALSIGFPITLTMKLTGGGISGYDPPESDIDKVVKEAWIGVRAMAKKVIEKYPRKNWINIEKSKINSKKLKL